MQSEASHKTCTHNENSSLWSLAADWGAHFVNERRHNGEHVSSEYGVVWARRTTAKCIVRHFNNCIHAFQLWEGRETDRERYLPIGDHHRAKTRLGSFVCSLVKTAFNVGSETSALSIVVYIGENRHHPIRSCDSPSKFVRIFCSWSFSNY